MEFLLVLLIFPIIIILVSVIGFILIKNWFVIPLLTFLVFLLLTYTIFNASFFIWVIVYTILSIITSLLMKVIKK